MNIYKIKIDGCQNKVSTASEREEVLDRYDGSDVVSVESVGPYINEAAYQAVRSEIVNT